MLQDLSLKQKRCKCGKILGDYRSHFCRSCAKKGRKNGMWKMIGEKHPRWKGRGLMKNGYIRISIPGKGRVYEHRAIIEKHLGRKLKRNEVVHHKNRIKNDNRLSNLILFENQSRHLKFENIKK